MAIPLPALDSALVEKWVFKVQVVLALTGLLHAYGQGTIAGNNINGAGTLFSTNFGRFFDLAGVPQSGTPINITILGGPDANSLSPIVTLQGANALVSVSLGRYTDPSGSAYTVPGVPSGQPATLRILAWIGSATTFENSNPVAGEQFWPFNGTIFIPPQTFTFVNPTGGATPASLDGMPGMWRILDAPEPSSTILIGLGAGIVWLLRRKQKTGVA